MHISSNEEAHATSGILLCVTFARHDIWFDGMKITMAKMRTYFFTIHFRTNLTPLASEFVAFHPLSDSRWGRLLYTCDFFMNTIRHIYLINRVSVEKKNASREKQHWFDCRTQTKSNVWLVMSRRNSDGNKWMSFRIPKRTTIASIRTSITYVNRNRCRNWYENTDLSHCESVSAVSFCRPQEKWLLATVLFYDFR